MYPDGLGERLMIRGFGHFGRFRRIGGSGLPGGLSLSGGVVWRPGGGDGNNQGIDRDIGGGGGCRINGSS
jgi:hypothetical protein